MDDVEEDDEPGDDAWPVAELLPSGELGWNFGYYDVGDFYGVAQGDDFG